jgi:hypothetical protein
VVRRRGDGKDFGDDVIRKGSTDQVSSDEKDRRRGGIFLRPLCRSTRVKLSACWMKVVE